MNSLIMITEMNCVSMNEIKHIVGFDNTCVVLETERGRVIIEGTDLKVESLEKEDGKIVITGKFSGLFFSEEKSKKSLLKRVFK